MKLLLERLTKLLEVKTIVTIAIIVTVLYLAVKGTIEAKDIMLLAMTVMTYFFTKDINKKA